MANRYADRYAKLRDAWSAKQPQRISTGGFKLPVPVGPDMLVSPQRNGAPFDYAGSSNYEYPKMLPGMTSQGATGDAGASMGLVPPGAFGGSLKGDVIDREQIPGVGAAQAPEQVNASQPALSPFNQTPGIFQGGGSPFSAGPPVPAAAPSQIPAIQPGALSKQQQFDPRFMNKPKAPLWP